jgi:hypothetical protein
MAGATTVSTTGTILANPNYTTTAADYQLYDEVMTKMEKTVSEMHQMVNELKDNSGRLEILLKKLKTDANYAGSKYTGLAEHATAVVAKLKAWDESMIQRKSTSYDDVENFPNKFTANYMFLMNQTESDMPQVNQPSLDLLKTYTEEWEKLKATGLQLKNESIPALNKQMWDLGMGAIW